MFYIHADPPKSSPPIPVRVSRRSQLTAALRQHARPIVIEDQELAGPFVRLLRARQLRLWGVGEFLANTMSCGIDQSYGANVEADWYVGRYILPGNVWRPPNFFGELGALRDWTGCGIRYCRADRGQDQVEKLTHC